MVTHVGNLALMAIAFGLMGFTVLFGVAVRWWTDWLGRILMGIFAPVTVVMLVVLVRVMGVDIPHLLVIRAVLYVVTAIAIWAGLVSFVWFQFFARPSRKDRHMGNTTKAPFWVTLVGLLAMAILTTVQNALANDSILDAQEVVQLGIQGVGAVNVFLAANLPGYDKVKLYVMAAIAGGQILYTAVGIASTGGTAVDTTEWINMAITILTALGIALVPTPLTTVQNGRVVEYVKGQHRPPLSRG